MPASADPPVLWRGDGHDQRGLVDDAPPPATLAGRHIRVRGLASPGLDAAVAVARARPAALSLARLVPDEPRSTVRDGARMVATLVPGTTLRLDAERRVDGEIVVAYGTAPVVVQHALMLGGPHVAMLCDERGATLLPVRPGVSACVRCLDLTRADRDPAWRVLAAQCETIAPPADALTGAVAGALAAAMLAALLASDDARAWRVERGLPCIVPAPAHQACGCGAAS